MKIRTKLLASFVAFGVVPMAGIGIASFLNAKSSSKDVAAHAVDGLTKSAENTLESVRRIKHTQITSYFDSAAKQVSTIAKDPQIASSLRSLTQGFYSYSNDRKVANEGVVDDRESMRRFYQSDFSDLYKQQNGGVSPNIESLLNKLSPEALALQNAFIASNPYPLGKKFELLESPAKSKYDAAHEHVHRYLTNYITEFGYYDMFLIDSKSGDLIYSVFKEADFATNLNHGPFSDSSLGRAFQKANNLTQNDPPVLLDFAKYFPSYEAPASFIATPVFDGNEKIGVLALQMSIDTINKVMDLGDTLGENTEAYIVANDYLPRSDSKLDSKNRTIVNAFRNPLQGTMKSDAVDHALKGESGVVQSVNYLGQPTISSYSPINVLGLNWAVIVDQPIDVALAEIADINDVNQKAQGSLVFWTLSLLFGSIAVIVPLSLVIIRSLMKPIESTIATLRDIAEGEGDLTRRLDENRADELGQLAKWFNKFANRIHDLICVVTENAQLLSANSVQLRSTAESLSSQVSSSKQQSASVSAAAEQMSVSMQNVSENSDSMNNSIRAVAASVEEMNSTIREIAGNAEKSATVAGQAASLVEESNDRITALGQSANEIGKVIQVIQEIAEQTNLLALNATIEAARAGEAGKGFAVVATEVKELAKQTAAATDDIRARIEAIQGSTTDAVGSIRAISDVINNVNEVSRSIAAAVEEQSITTRQISDNVLQSASAAETVARGISETALASREITENFAKVDSVLDKSAMGADESLEAGTQLSELAQDMSKLVGQFKVKSENRALVRR
ncbi:MAG: methyl-accepting chemotaxis protein [Pirellula sp.]|jgi:methyl-accepting chemotaxis protein|nr:methyl-accepting chemotaxis protein [Pirellula sp.]